MLVAGFVAARPAKLRIMIVWHSRIQLLRRPIRSSPGSFSRSTTGDQRNLKLYDRPIHDSTPMVARLIFASPSQAFSVPMSSANGSPDEKPNASIIEDFRVASAAARSLNPFGRAAAATYPSSPREMRD